MKPYRWANYIQLSANKLYYLTELLMFDRNTWIRLTVCKQMSGSNFLKKWSHKQTLYLEMTHTHTYTRAHTHIHIFIHINRIWHWITHKGWHAIKLLPTKIFLTQTTSGFLSLLSLFNDILLCSCLRCHNYKMNQSRGSQRAVKLRVYSHLEGRNVWHYISQTNPYCPWI